MAAVIGDARPVPAAIVLGNVSDFNVEVEFDPPVGTLRKQLLGRDQTVALQTAGNVRVTYRSGKSKGTYLLDPSTLHLFVPNSDGVELMQASFSGRYAGRLPQPTQQPDLPLVIPVKLLADEGHPAVQRVWEQQLRQQVQAASEILAEYCPVRLEVVAVEKWPAGNSRDLAELRQRFRDEVHPGPGWLAIGVASQCRYRRWQVTSRDDPREPLFAHIFLPNVQSDFSSDDQLLLLVHELAHFLGAVHVDEAHSIMRPKYLDGRRTAALAHQFDPVNTLIMNLMADELRASGEPAVEAMSAASRDYLGAIYGELATADKADAQIARVAKLFREANLSGPRYLARWPDGSRMRGHRLGPWNATDSSPRLSDRPLFAGDRAVRWLTDLSLEPAGPMEAGVEFVCGDRLPGLVQEYRDGTADENDRLPPHLVVSPVEPTDRPGGPIRSQVRVSLAAARRIVWQRVTDRYQPRIAFLRDGRQLEYRSLRFQPTGVQLLRGSGVDAIPFDQLAELHLPAADPWEAWLDQLAALAPSPGTKISQIETIWGLRATGTTERFQATARGPADKPESWHHLVQPAWSLDPLWVNHSAIRTRHYFEPHEAPLSAIAPASVRQQSALGGCWPWQADRNVHGSLLVAGGTPAPWGFGVHGQCDLEFPLPAFARRLQTRLGLDQRAERGGCVQASVLLKDGGQQKPLYRSPVMIGSGRALDTGWLDLRASKPGASLILRVDAEPSERPPQSDPLDIRDLFDWVEPLVELDSAAVQAEIDARGPRQIPAWQNWKVVSDHGDGVRLVSRWDASDKTQGAYRLFTAVGELRLSSRLSIRPGNEQLLLSVSRLPDSVPSQIEVRIDGKPAQTFELPVRSRASTPPLAVSLAEHRGRPVNVEILQRSRSPNALVEWRAISLAPLR